MSRKPLIAAALLLALRAAAASAAIIGILSDSRQSPFLSLLGDSSGPARFTLLADGHSLITLNSLNPSVLDTVDILWLPLLAADQTYTDQERTDLAQFLTSGGRLIWIGDADVFNTGDNSFLSAFGLAKLPGNLEAPLTPALPDHPALTGPFGLVEQIAANSGYGLFTPAPDVAAAFANPDGVLVGFIAPETGYIGDGRAALICESSLFGQLLALNDHTALLRNLVAWTAAESGYTPAGQSVPVDLADSACTACPALSITFSSISATGLTTAAPTAFGPCGLDPIPDSALPPFFSGYAFSITTTASLPPTATIDLDLTYDSADLAAIGLTDESALRLYRFDSTAVALTDITLAADPAADHITGRAAQLGLFVLGAAASLPDCNANGTADVCEIPAIGPAPAGPYFCTAACDPDCNANGTPDSCDAAAPNADCNHNNIPDSCDAPSQLGFSVDPPDSGDLTPAAPAEFDPCDLVPISATPRPGFCFSHWTVTAGDPPADPSAASTSVPADANKLVIAHFIPIILTHPQGYAACPDQPAVITVAAHPDLDDDAIYQWQFNGDDLLDDSTISGANAATLTINPFTPDRAGNYACLVSHPCGDDLSDLAVLTPGAPLQIDAQPVDAFACPGQSASFHVAVSGTAPTFQWQFDDGSGFQILADSGPISGSLTDTLTLSAVQPPRAGRYRCQIDGTCGPSLLSSEAVLVVGEFAAVLAVPTPQFACPGDPAAFTVSASGTGLSYRWQFNPGTGFTDLSDGPVISGASTNTLTIQLASTSNAGAFRCIITSTCSPPITTPAANLTIGAAPSILIPASSQTACLNQTRIFQIAAVATAVSYQWQFDPGSGYNDLTDDPHYSGATTHILTVQNITAAHAGDYRCIVSGTCAPPAIAPAATLTVGQPTAIQSDPVPQTACPGQQVVFTTAAEGLDLSYQWQFAAASIYSNLSNGPGVSGAATPTLILTNVQPNRAGNYRCVVLGACGPSLIGASAALAINPGACDCNANGTPDSTDIASGLAADCNENNRPDACELADHSALDCNSNAVPDECDLAAGHPDCNADGIPDPCQLADNDCNATATPDDCELTDNDCNHNAVPDECEPPYLADAGPDRSICLDQPSPPLGGPVVATGSIPPYTYAWSILSGPAEGATLLSPSAARARLIASLPGAYEIELLISDSASPPCTTSDIVLITAAPFTVDAGNDLALCMGATTTALSPSITGGTPPYTHAWSILPGSPNSAASQFTGPGPAAPDPTFTPAAPGIYTLRLTVLDSATPPCIAVDELQIHARQIILQPGPNLFLCVGSDSPPLPVAITAPNDAALTYEWSIDPQSPDTNPAQFLAPGPTSAHPVFRPSAPGAYTLRLSVRDDSSPACEASATLTVTASALSVDAGAAPQTCVLGDGHLLAPTTTGGRAPLSYLWTVEPGSPSLSPLQLTSPGPSGSAPLFIPAAPGDYTLRLTITDSASPPCTATDTLTFHASLLTAHAGIDLVTPAFSPSAPLGPTTLATGATAPVSYSWSIPGGPSRAASQLSSPTAAHPTFTPSLVGTYELELAVTSAGCTAVDRLIIEAIANELTAPINSAGKLFLDLRLDQPHTRALLRVAKATIGAQVHALLTDDPGDAEFSGLATPAKFPRRLRVQAPPDAFPLIATVVLYFSPDELAQPDFEADRICWFNEVTKQWQPIGTRDLENGPFPSGPIEADIGRQGWSKDAGYAWAIVRRLGDFTLAVPDGTAAPVTDDPAAIVDLNGDGQPDSESPPAPNPAPACGASDTCAPGASLSIGALFLLRPTRKRRRSHRT